MGKSLKINYIFNLLNTITGLLFPLITFPYASRIMLADGIGQVNFFQSIIQYITLFTCLGIPMYAIRKIASVRDDVGERNKVAVEILLLHATLSLIGYVIVTTLAAFVSDIQVNIPLFLILSLTIFFTAIGCEWFYQGIEDFKYITIRGLIVKTIAVILLFVFVRTKEDILWYAGYLVFGILGGNIFNFIRLRRFISFRKLPWKELHPLVHLKPALHIFVYNVIISIYLQLNTIMLGFLGTVTSVGLYVTSTKLLSITMAIPNSLGTVVLPRTSNLIAEGHNEELKSICQKSYDFILAITFPLVILLYMTSSYAIGFLGGSGFSDAVLSSKIISPIILLVGISGVLGYQILYPTGKVDIVIKSTFWGACVDLLLCILLIPVYGHNGAAIAYLTAEFTVTFAIMLMGKKYVPIKYFDKKYTDYVIASLIMACCLTMVNKISLPDIQMIVINFFAGGTVYITVLALRKNPVVSLLKNIHHKH